MVRNYFIVICDPLNFLLNLSTVLETFFIFVNGISFEILRRNLSVYVLRLSDLMHIDMADISVRTSTYEIRAKESVLSIEKSFGTVFCSTL